MRFAWTTKTRVGRRATLVEPSPFVVSLGGLPRSTLGSFDRALTPPSKLGGICLPCPSAPLRSTTAAVSLVFSIPGVQLHPVHPGLGERSTARRPAVSRATSGSEDPDAAPSPTRRPALGRSTTTAHGVLGHAGPSACARSARRRTDLGSPPPGGVGHHPKGWLACLRLHRPEGQLRSHRAPIGSPRPPSAR